MIYSHKNIKLFFQNRQPMFPRPFWHSAIISKPIPLQAWTGSKGSRNLRGPEFLDIQHMKAARLSALLTLQKVAIIPISVSGWIEARTIVRPEGLSKLKSQFYIHGSVHRNSILIRCNSMQVFIYCQNHSTCFGCPSHPSSGVHITVTAASGTGHSIWATTFIQLGHIWPRWKKVDAYVFLMMGAMETRNM